MVCSQIKIYMAYIVVQIIIMVMVVGPSEIKLIAPLLFIGLLYVLCQYNHKKLANILLGIIIGFGVLMDIYALTHKKLIKHTLHVKAQERHPNK
jgi:cell shape-determining protein MreD